MERRRLLENAFIGTNKPREHIESDRETTWLNYVDIEDYESSTHSEP